MLALFNAYFRDATPSHTSICPIEPITKANGYFSEGYHAIICPPNHRFISKEKERKKKKEKY